MVTFAIAEGNPGALTFLMKAYDNNMAGAELGFSRMQRNGITGARLYMLWNDCCERNTEMAIYIMNEEDVSEIINHIDGGKGRGIPFPDAGSIGRRS